MKHEAMVRAMSALDDDLIAEALSAAKPRKVRAFPRVLAAAACLALIVTAALTLTRRAPETDILIGGTVLTRAPVPIDQPAPMALAPVESAQPLSVSFTFDASADTPLTAEVSGGVLDSPLDSAARGLSSRTVSGGETLTWTIEAPDEDAVYTLCLDGAPAAVLRYDAASGYWTAARA